MDELQCLLYSKHLKVQQTPSNNSLQLSSLTAASNVQPRSTAVDPRLSAAEKSSLNLTSDSSDDASLGGKYIQQHADIYTPWMGFRFIIETVPKSLPSKQSLLYNKHVSAVSRLSRVMFEQVYNRQLLIDDDDLKPILTSYLTDTNCS